MRVPISVAMVFSLVYVLGSHAAAGTPGGDWQADVQALLSQYLACQEPIDDTSPCNRFLGKALKSVYGISDFDVAPNDYMLANDIAIYVATNPDKWTSLGTADSQDALDQAAGYANLQKAVIAVHPGTGHGHVALVLPGALTPSGNWGLNVPNSASFFQNKPKQSYVGRGLSYAFTAPAGVTIYGRNY
jgi:hypothetical protein